MRAIDADKLEQAILDEWGDSDSANWVPDILRKMDEAPTIDNTDAYVRGYNAGVQMSIKLFLSLGGEDDDSVQM